jgi:hypothetical protein
MNKPVKFLSVASALLAVSSFSAADQTSDDEWEFSASPLFLWGMNIDGDATIGDVTAPLDLDFNNDILENLELVLTFHFEARKGKWSILSEVQYADLEPSATISQDNPPASAKDDITFKDYLFEVGGGYAFYESAKTRLELIGGARYNRQELEVKVGLAPPGPEDPILVDKKNDDDWWQPFAGGRLFYSLTENWTFAARADYGYADSDNTVVNASFFFDYQFNDWGSLMAGYKYMDFDYDNGLKGNNHYAYDATQEGPLLGLTIYW